LSRSLRTASALKFGQISEKRAAVFLLIAENSNRQILRDEIDLIAQPNDFFVLRDRAFGLLKYWRVWREIMPGSARASRAGFGASPKQALDAAARESSRRRGAFAGTRGACAPQHGRVASA
jgi:hypothetical protein